MLDGLAKSLKNLRLDAVDGLVDQAMKAMNDPAQGVLSAMVEKARASALGDSVNSWIAAGTANLPITADQLKAAPACVHTNVGLPPTRNVTIGGRE